MSADLDTLGLLRKYGHMDELKKQAADEIEILNKVIDLLVKKNTTRRFL